MPLKDPTTILARHLFPPMPGPLVHSFSVQKPVPTKSKSRSRHIVYSRTFWLMLLVLALVGFLVSLDYDTGHFRGDVYSSTLSALVSMSNLERSSYLLNVMHGRQVMKEKRALFVGLAHNIAKELPRVDEYIRKTGALFADYAIILFENDSTDDTVAVIQNLSEAHNSESAGRFFYISEHLAGGLSAIAFGGFSTFRFARLAYARNQLLDTIRNHHHYSTFDYVFMIDMDMELGWKEDGIAHTIGLQSAANADTMSEPMSAASQSQQLISTNRHTQSVENEASILPDQQKPVVNWDVMCGNGISDDGIHYDALAFRSEEFPDTRNDEQRFDAMRVYREGTSPVNVISCFGGMTIYQMEMITKTHCNYTDADCEHVGFHKCLKQEMPQSRLMMNPSMIVYYGWSASMMLKRHYFKYLIFAFTLVFLMCKIFPNSITSFKKSIFRKFVRSAQLSPQLQLTSGEEISPALLLPALGAQWSLNFDYPWDRNAHLFALRTSINSVVSCCHTPLGLRQVITAK